MPPEDWMRKRETRLDRSRRNIRPYSRFGFVKIALLMIVLAIVIKMIVFPDRPIPFFGQGGAPDRAAGLLQTSYGASCMDDPSYMDDHCAPHALFMLEASHTL